MGQSQSQSPTDNVSQLYSAYIKQQQALIYAQQQQINQLYYHNLETKQQAPSNIYMQQAPKQLPMIEPKKDKLDPYKLLNISKNYDEKTLKKAYLKTAMKAHPDRGGSAQEFQKVSIAYTVLLNKLKEQNNNHLHNDLRNMSREYVKQQGAAPKQNINMKDKFDIDVFNKIYQENKIADNYEEGYGSWMKQNPALESGQQRLFQNGFNKDMFNATFDQYKQQQSKQYSEQLVTYEPETRLSMKNQDSLVQLGGGKVTDFSGESNNLQFTDYKKAYTYGSTLINTQSVSMNDRANSIGDIKSQRSNLSYELSPEDRQQLAIQQMKQEQEEKKRIQRLQVYDQRHGQAYEKIHSLLLR